MSDKPSYEQLEDRITKLEREIRELKALRKAVTTISSSPTLKETLESIATQIANALDSSGCSILLWHPDKNQIENLIDHNKFYPDQIDKPGKTYDLADYPAELNMLETGQTLLVRLDDPTAHATERALMKEQGIFTSLSLPLKTSKQIIGLLEIYEDVKPRQFTKSEIRFAESLAFQAAIALENARLYTDAQNEIDKRKRTEEELRESEAKYRILFEKANIAISVVQDGFVKSPNPKLLDLHGYSEEEITSMPFKHFVHPEDREMVQDRHKRRLKGEELPTTYSYRIFDKAGDTKWVELNLVTILWEGKPATLCFLTDITYQKQAEEKRKRLEDQLQQAQKMEAIGTLAGGVAHDFNNLLMGIQGRTSLILMNKESAHPDYEHLKGIEEYVRSAADLTKQLLGFARGGKYEIKAVDVNALVQKSAQMFGRTKKEIVIHPKYPKDIWTMEVDPAQIEQVLLNLYVNAWQSMPGGGELYLETENVTLDGDYVEPFGVEPGDYVKISVTDTGTGMDERTRERIFEPFFTTKEMGRGTGLGLASSYGIIKNHNGVINVYSEIGHGTTFNIYLPASRQLSVKIDEESKKIVKGQGTVLLVDDEEIIIDVAQGMLAGLGYTVLVAGSGKKAIDIYREKQAQIHLVIIDMIMPEMGGGVVYDQLKEINPDVKAILSSGYSINGKAQEILKRGCDGFLQKPFNMSELSLKLRKILDQTKIDL